MRYVLGTAALLAAIGTAAYFYMQDQDGQAAEAKADAPEATPEPETNI